MCSGILNKFGDYHKQNQDQMKAELIAKLEELLTKDAGEVAHDVRALQREFQKEWTREFENARQAFIEEGGKAKEFDYPKQAEDLRFEELMVQFNRKKKENDAKQAAEQSKNLSIRLDIIARIKDISALSENVGAGIRKLQELQSLWKETGPVASEKYKEVQSEYSKAVEEFYYNLKIYRDLQEHDLKKNFELKSAIIEKIRNIDQVESVKEAERLLKVFRNEWEEIGPVPNEKWEALKAEFKTALDAVYAKIKAFYSAAEEQREENLKLKEELLEKARTILQNAANAGTGKWNKLTDELLAIQESWKDIGRAIESENERVWSEFRALCDAFFEKKKSFFGELNEKQQEFRKIKNEIIEKAEALMHQTDWQKTSQALIKLQEEWKKYPGHGDKEEPKLYQRFRAACDTFFNAKKAHFAGQDAEQVNNLEKKEEILSRINAFELSSDNQANREALKAFTNEWNAVGHVPMKDKKRVNDTFYAKLDELYGKMNMDRKEKDAMQFNSKLERLASSDKAFDALRKEADHLRKIADEITSTIRTYENNLGFFKNAKGNPLLAEAESKIAAEKAKLDEVNAKRKQVTAELNKIREAGKAPAGA